MDEEPMRILLVEDNADDAWRPGPNDYLSKPVSLKKLVSVIAAYVEPTQIQEGRLCRQ